MTLQTLEALYATIPVIGMIEGIRKYHKKKILDGLEIYRGSRRAMHMSGPKRLDKYYTPCMKRYKNKEYCARVSWSIYCSHVDPKYPGCTRYGKKWGKPYSKPLSVAR